MIELLGEVDWQMVAIMAAIVGGGSGAKSLYGSVRRRNGNSSGGNGVCAVDRRNGKSSGGNGVCALHHQFEKRLDERHAETNRRLTEIQGSLQALHGKFDAQR